MILAFTLIAPPQSIGYIAPSSEDRPPFHEEIDSLVPLKVLHYYFCIIGSVFDVVLPRLLG
jgi:hypothetical protein